MSLNAGHTGIVVQDLERMTRFYIEVFGLTETRRMTREGRPLDQLLGLERIKLDVVFLGTPDRPAAIELLKYVRHPDAVVQRYPNTHGVNHVHFISDNLDPIVARLTDAGIESVGGPVDWFDTWSRVLYTRDLEKNLVEITEVPPGEPMPYVSTN